MMDYHLQHTDRNVGPNRRTDALSIRKIFRTIQGEGPFAGYPAIFIRTAGCDRGEKQGMGCEFCDTDFRLEAARWMSPPAIAAEIAFIEVATRFVVITGGEPMLQGALPILIRELAQQKYRIQIESNGDRLVPGWDQLALNNLINLYLVVCPKVSMRKGQYRYLPLKPEVIQAASAFKFLIDADPASPYFNVPPYAGELSPAAIYLSPIAAYKRAVEPGEIASGWDHTLIDVARTRANYQYAAELAIAHGFLLSIQSHLFMSWE